jgi:hypothetical protein
MKRLLTILLAFVPVIFVTAQNNDDLYYTPSKKTQDFQPEKTIDDYTPVDKPYEEPPYSTPDGQQFDGTGNADNYDYNYNNNGTSQQRKGISTDSYDDGYGNTYITNNYYGDYYDDQYPDYTARMNRYYSPTVGFGYYNCYYDPFWYDPFWNPAWGWNSWYYQPGFNISFGWGWGSPWFGNRWNNWGWGNPYYGWGWNNWGWGNPYWNGYNHGYWHGYHDGYYGNYWNSGLYGNNFGNSSNNSYYGPRRMSAPAEGTTNNSSTVNGPRVIKSEIPAVNDNSRAITTNKNPNDIRPSTYDSKKTPESYSIDRNKAGVESAKPNDTRINSNNSGKTGISVPNNNQPRNYAPPRSGGSNEIRNNPNTKTNIRIDNKNSRDIQPRVNPSNPGRNQGGSIRNENKTQPSYNHGGNKPSDFRNNHHSAPPVRNNSPSMSAPSRGGSVSPASPNNIRGGGGKGIR